MYDIVLHALFLVCLYDITVRHVNDWSTTHQLRCLCCVERGYVKDMDHGRRQRTNDDAMTSELLIDGRA